MLASIRYACQMGTARLLVLATWSNVADMIAEIFPYSQHGYCWLQAQKLPELHETRKS